MRPMSGFREPELPRDQLMLWGQRLDDAIPAGHPVRTVQTILWSAVFDEVFAEWERRYAQMIGRPAYHPRYLAALFIYGCMIRERSSRQLEAACGNRIDVMWLMEGQRPDHSTIAEFVQRHKEDLRGLFKRVLKVAREAGLLTGELGAVDGTKVWAHASRESVHSAAWLQQEEAKLEGVVKAIEAEYAANEGRMGPLLEEIKEGGRPEERRRRAQQRQARVQAALAKLAERGGGQAGRVNADSVTDPESRPMKDKAGQTRPCYNAQVAVDGALGLVTAVAVNDAAGDEGQLTPLVAQTAENTGARPAGVTADSQYNTGPELAAAEAARVTTYLPDNGKRGVGPAREVREAAERIRRGEELSAAELERLKELGGGQLPKELFTYEATSDVYICPRGERLRCEGQERARRSWGEIETRRYGGAACGDCPWRGYCCGAKTKSRSIMRDEYEPQRERLRGRMETEEGRQVYARRAPLVERVFGHVKGQWGVRQFLRRGVAGVRAEWTLLMTAYNLRLLLSHAAAVLAVVGAGGAQGP